MRAAWRDPLAWALIVFTGLVVGMPALRPLFAAAFPQLDRPMYVQDDFVALTLAHAALVAASSAVSVGLGLAAAVAATRPAGREFRPLLEGLVAAGQTVPPVAVLAVAVPLLGFGAGPALIALALYGLLPVVQAALAGLDAVPEPVLESARGLGLDGGQQLFRVELPLAWPVILAGVRTSVIVNIGTASVASTVGARTLGSPIIVGLSGFNTAYVIQGAVLVGLMAVVTDLAFGRLEQRAARQRIVQ